MRTLALLAMTLATSPALAGEGFWFQSPTGNIHCVLDVWEGQAEARCDLVTLTPSYTARPAGCDLDWGSAFSVGARGRGALACVGDTVVNPAAPVLPYGEALSLGGIACVSARTGMTCTNADGHGFSVARASQRLF